MPSHPEPHRLSVAWKAVPVAPVSRVDPYGVRYSYLGPFADRPIGGYPPEIDAFRRPDPSYYSGYQGSFADRPIGGYAPSLDTIPPPPLEGAGGPPPPAVVRYWP